MKLTVDALLTGAMFAIGCAGVPRADVAYRGNGDARILKFMSGNYMSAPDGVGRLLTLHLMESLPPGRVIDKPYLIKRGAVCSDATPVVCTFTGVADEHFRGVPEEHARWAHRVTRIAARVLLRDAATVEVTKEESYPDVNKT
jgi:hypothetical protein